MKPQMENSLRARHLAKSVYESKLIADMENPDRADASWSMDGIAEMSFSAERSKNGTQSLRVVSPYRNEEFIRKTTEENGYFNAGSGTSSSAELTFAEPQDWRDFNRISLWIYPHRRQQRTYVVRMGFNCKGAPRHATSPRAALIIQNLEPGKWNHVVWEIANLTRDRVIRLSLSFSHRGSDNGKHDGSETYDIDFIELQRVDAEQYEGWEVAPGRIAFHHSGYKPEQVKTAVTSGSNIAEFELVNANTDETIITRSVDRVRNSRGSFAVMDFSDVRAEGKYYLRVGDVTSRPFVIADTLWRQPIYKCINGFYGLRCGYDIPGIHDECHRDWQGTHNGETKIINGGWHDAGDLSQGSFRTVPAIYAMLDIVHQLKERNLDPQLVQRVLDEALWGLDWLLKTRFRDGYRLTWSMMRIYTDGIVGNYDDVKVPAQNVPWENFLASAVESRAYEVLKNENPSLAERSLTAAQEDWQAAVDRQEEWIASGDEGIGSFGASSGTYLTASWGVVSSVNLHSITGDKKYADRAVEYGRLLMRCQERRFVDGIPVTGYFYTGPKKLSILHHIHPAFEESPLLALEALCGEFPENPDWIEWYGAVALYSEYFIKRGAEYSSPYRLIPNSVYRRFEIETLSDPDVRRDAMRQFEEGTRLADDYYLRVFPIWGNNLFHGNTGVHLSMTMALTAAVTTRSDLAGENLVAQQLQWVFGGNPFSQSLMYGEGYDFASLFAFNPGDIVGTLPVGMDCMSNDAPYWDDCNLATYKEIWVVPMSRFLWNVSRLAFPAHVKGRIISGKIDPESNRGQTGSTGSEGSILFLNTDTGEKIYVETGDAGEFEANLPAGNYKIEYKNLTQHLTLVSGGNYSLNLNPASFVDIQAEAEMKGTDTVTITALLTGAGSHFLNLHCTNGIISGAERNIALTSDEKQSIEWVIKVRDTDEPWIAVIIPDGNIMLKHELTGTCIDH